MLSRKSWRTGGRRFSAGDDCSGPGASSQNHRRFQAERGAWRSDGGQTSVRQPMRDARVSRYRGRRSRLKEIMTVTSDTTLQT